MDYSAGFTPGKEPTVAYPTDNDGPVATFNYSKEARASDSDAATYGELNITSSYSCAIYFGTFKVNGSQQAALIESPSFRTSRSNMYSQWSHTGAGAVPFNKTYSDIYIMSTQADGTLELKPSPAREDHTTHEDTSGGDASGIANFFTHVNDVIDDLKNKTSGFLQASIKTMPFDKLKSFVFLAHAFFAYAHAAFSDHKDLVSSITYVNPTDNQFKSQGAAVDIHAVQPRHQMVLAAAVPWHEAAISTIRKDAAPASAAASSAVYRAASQGANANGLPAQWEIQAKNASNATVPAAANGQVKGTIPLSTAVIVARRFCRDIDLCPPVTNECNRIFFASRIAAQVSDKVQVSSATEMMLNYVQGEIIKPTGKFQALQMSDGTALLFAVDSNGALNIIDENVGKSHTGWTISDISSKVVADTFGGAAPVQTFSVNQSVMDEGSISLAMA